MRRTPHSAGNTPKQHSSRCAADWLVLAAPAASRAPAGRRNSRFITSGVWALRLALLAPNAMHARALSKPATAADLTTQKKAACGRLLCVRGCFGFGLLLAGMPAAVFALE